jgi:hypothetical protein
MTAKVFVVGPQQNKTVGCKTGLDVRREGRSVLRSIRVGRTVRETGCNSHDRVAGTRSRVSVAACPQRYVDRAKAHPAVSVQPEARSPLPNSSTSDDTASTGGATEDAHNRRNRMDPNSIRVSSIPDRNSRSVHNSTQGSILGRNKRDQECQC